MSYDLFVFKGPIPRTEVEFTGLLERFQEIPKLARKHGLALMDPQSRVIVRP